MPGGAQNWGMTMTQDDRELDALFAVAREEGQRPSPALMARILADADALQPGPQGLAPPARAVPPRTSSGLIGRLLDLIGGPGALAGLVSAAGAGLWLGFVQPTPVTSVAQAWGIETASLAEVDLMPSLDTYLAGN